MKLKLLPIILLCSQTLYSKELETFLSTQKSLIQECIRPVTYKVKINDKVYNRYVWSMPKGYAVGASLSFATSYCQSKQPPAALSAHFQKLNSKAEDSRDSLSRIRPLPTSHQNISSHVLTYSLLMSLGMIESSGNPHEGMYLGDYFLSAQTAETGLFQVSYNSLSTIVPRTIYDALVVNHMQNASNPTALDENIKSIFYWRKAPRGSHDSPSWGQGVGYLFQEQMKVNPTLAFEYAAALVRRSSTHHGPIIRKEPQLKNPCTEMLESLRKWLDSNPSRCSGLSQEISQMSRSDFMDQLVVNINPDPLVITQNDFSKSLNLPKLSVIAFVSREIEEDLRKNPLSIKEPILLHLKQVLKILKAELSQDGRYALPMPDYSQILNEHSLLLDRLKEIDPLSKLFISQRFLEMYQLMTSRSSIDSMKNSATLKLSKLEKFMSEQQNQVPPAQWKVLEREHLLRSAEKRYWETVRIADKI